MNVDTLFPKRLELALTYKQMSQASLARTLGMKAQNLSHIKNGKRPGFSKLQKIAKALDCSVDWLCLGEGQAPEWLKNVDAELRGASSISSEELIRAAGGAAGKIAEAMVKVKEPSANYEAEDQAGSIKMLMEMNVTLVNTNARLSAQNEDLTQKMNILIEKMNISLDKVDGLEARLAEASLPDRDQQGATG